jgi:hypothetical protein
MLAYSLNFKVEMNENLSLKAVNSLTFSFERAFLQLSRGCDLRVPSAGEQQLPGKGSCFVLELRINWSLGTEVVADFPEPARKCGAKPLIKTSQCSPTFRESNCQTSRAQEL